MIIQNPGEVRFGEVAWTDATLVVIERVGTRVIEEHDDRGSFAAFVDVVEQSIHVRVQRSPAADDVEDPPLGMAGELVVHAARPGDGRGRKRITVRCVVTAIRPEVLGGGRGVVKTITLRAVSEDGADPVVVDGGSMSEA